MKIRHRVIGNSCCSREGFVQACMQVANTKVYSHERPFSPVHFSKAQPGSLENTGLGGAGVGSTAPVRRGYVGGCRQEMMWLGPKATAARMKRRVVCLRESMCLTAGLSLGCVDWILNVVIPELERLRQEDFKFETTLGSTAKPYFKKQAKIFYACLYG